MHKGFFLIDTLLGVFLLGLVIATVVPIIDSSYANLNSQRIKAEMIYTGESVIEKIKSYDKYKPSDVNIYDTSISEIIDLFSNEDTVEIILPKDINNGEYIIEIIKEQKCAELWAITVKVNEKKEGSSVNHVMYKAYLPQK